MRAFIGYDPREERAFQVCEASMRKHATCELDIQRLELADLVARNIYKRPHVRRKGQLWDVISELPMSTEFAISRFLVPYLCGYKGWALFCDCDFLWRADVTRLFARANEAYAVMVVKHNYEPPSVKMDQQTNLEYRRKNWSSMMLWNCEHPANTRLTPHMVNTRHRHELHGFFWLLDWQIGALPFEWNWLDLEPHAVHFTNGTPDMPGHEQTAYANEYRSYLE